MVANALAALVAVTLPDGSVRHYDRIVRGDEVARDIGPGLAKAALAVRIDGVLKDLQAPISGNVKLEIVTARDSKPDVLELIRHDAAHVLAEAVQNLLRERPGAISPPR